MKDTNSVSDQPDPQGDNSLASLEDSSADLNHLTEKQRLSTAMSSYYLLYR